jgi:GAF domain-containing protein
LANAWDDERFLPPTFSQKQPLSMLVTPMKIGDRTIGVISVDKDKYDWFNDSDRQLVEALAQQAGIAVQRSNTLDLLQEIGHQIISTQATSDILEQIVKGAIKLTNTTSGVIYLVSDNGKSVSDRFHPPGYEHPEPRLDSEQSITRQVLKSGHVMSFSNLCNDDRVNPALRDDFQSMIAIPLKLKDKVIGVLYLNDKNQREFTTADIALLSTLADQAAIAIQTISLFKENQNRLKLSQVLQETSLDIVRQSVLDELMPAIIERAANLMAGDSFSGVGAAYWECDDVGGKAKILYSPNPNLINREADLKEGLIGKVIATKQGQFINDYPHWSGRIPSFDENRDLMKNLIEVPIWHDNKIKRKEFKVRR